MRFSHLPLILILAFMLGCSSVSPVGRPSDVAVSQSDRIFARAFDERARSLQVEGSGVVKQILSDDNDGRRHQRFVVQLESGQTLLIAHNIDLAPRVPALREGDRVEFSGEYEWNPEGGVIHWTHHDPDRHHVPGWLRHNGRTYQ